MCGPTTMPKWLGVALLPQLNSIARPCLPASTTWGIDSSSSKFMLRIQHAGIAPRVISSNFSRSGNSVPLQTSLRISAVSEQQMVAPMPVGVTVTSCAMPGLRSVSVWLVLLVVATIRLSTYTLYEPASSIHDSVAPVALTASTVSPLALPEHVVEIPCTFHVISKPLLVTEPSLWNQMVTSPLVAVTLKDPVPAISSTILVPVIMLPS